METLFGFFLGAMVVLVIGFIVQNKDFKNPFNY